MYGVGEYIKQIFPKGCEYSEMLYQPSQVAGATAFVQRNFNARGAKLILVSSLFLQTPVIPPPAIAIVDRYNRILFQFVGQTDVSGFYETPYFLSGSELFFSCNNNTVNFTIGFQYLMEKERP